MDAQTVLPDDTSLLERWSAALPPAVDLSHKARHWFAYNEMHEKWRQRELEPLVAQEHCMLLACDSKRDQATKRYIACGFEVFWREYRTIAVRAEKAMRYLKHLRSNQPCDTPFSSEQCIKMAAAEQYACAASYYEMVVPNRPCHLAFDIEYYHNAYNRRPFEQLVDMFLSLLSLLLHEYYGLDDARRHWHEAWTDSSNDEKISRHLIIRLPCQLMFADMLHCGALTRRLACLAIREYGEPVCNPLFVAGADGSDSDFVPSNDSLVVFWDPLIYTRYRALRMVGSSKIGKFRFFRPLVYSSPLSQTTPLENTDTNAPVISLSDTLPLDDTDYVTRTCILQDVAQLDRRFFWTTLVHAPCDHPERTRLLYASEPDGRACFSTTLLPTHRQRRYILTQHTVGRAGSIPSGSLFRQANEQGSALVRDERLAAHNLHGVDDPSNLEWTRFTYRERCTYVQQSDSASSTDDRTTRAMTLLLLDACDALVPHLHLPPEGHGSSNKATQYQQYYRVHCNERVALVQLAHHWCPLSRVTHKSNHMRYLVQLQPYNQLQPQYRAACFKCRASHKDFAPLPFWNDEWRKRLEHVEQQEMQQYQRPAYKLFGFIASALWPSTETCTSDDDNSDG